MVVVFLRIWNFYVFYVNLISRLIAWFLKLKAVMFSMMMILSTKLNPKIINYPTKSKIHKAKSENLYI